MKNLIILAVVLTTNTIAFGQSSTQQNNQEISANVMVDDYYQIKPTSLDGIVNQLTQTSEVATKVNTKTTTLKAANKISIAAMKNNLSKSAFAIAAVDAKIGVPVIKADVNNALSLGMDDDIDVQVAAPGSK